MILDIVHYGNRVLRTKGARIDKITPEIQTLIANMFETLDHAQGVGLAAQQVGHALQLAILDVRDVTDRPSTLFIDGKEVNPDEHMPMVIINPELKMLGEKVIGPEGCLSFPEVYSDVSRAPEVEVGALNQHGQAVQFRCGGLLARAVQHETDHLNGILFIDRMTRHAKEQIQDELDELEEAAVKPAEAKRKGSAKGRA